ncbi:MAG TPA: polymer-forming cytoskeletal protein [Bryobacteraceae bacterium]|nr:polymer-forming cytoskeletal protein [Bryobacteraceae bacterium]
MWNKKRDDEYTPKPAGQPVHPAQDVKPEPASYASTSAPVKAPAAEPPRGVAAIGKSVIIKGNILSREDLWLDGEVEGTVEVPEHRLTIGPHAKLNAGIRAREVIVLGGVNGDVEAMEKIDIRKDAKLVGNIKTGGIIIEDGAYFKGSIDIIRSQEAAKPAVQPRPKEQPTATPVAAAVAVEQKR